MTLRVTKRITTVQTIEEDDSIVGPPDPPPPPPPPPPGNVTTTEFDNATWTLGVDATGGKLVLRNGSPVGGAGIAFRVANDRLLLLNSFGQWFVWTGNGWEAAGDPDVLVVAMRPANPDVPTLGLVDAAWRTRVDTWPVHPQSDAILRAQPLPVSGLYRFHNDFGPDDGIPYSAGAGYPPVPVNITAYPQESDAGPHPIPQDAQRALAGDKHLLYYENSQNKLYELFNADLTSAGFRCDSCAVWDMAKDYAQRPIGWTSADAAGLPMLPLMVRFDEFDRAMAEPDPANQHLGHALRFTLPNTGRGFIPPARHYASTVNYILPNRPPMGMRIRINPAFDLTPYSPPAQVLLRTLQRFGGVLADNGAAWFFTGTPDQRWAKYFDYITGNIDGKWGFKGSPSGGFSNATWLANVQVLAFAESDVVTQV